MKCLAFDLGKVLFDFDYMIALEKIKDKMKASSDDVLRAIFNDEYGLDFERGSISSRQFYRNFVDLFGVKINYDEFVSLWCQIFSPRYEVIALVEQLKRRYPLYLISNINELHFRHLHQNFPHVFSLFEGLILSFEVKAVKPEAKIYYALQQKAAVPFSQIIYVDDREELLEEARKLQLHCILFRDIVQLRRALKKYNVFLPQRGSA